MNKRDILDAVNTYANLQQVAATEKLKVVAKEQAVVAKEQTAAIVEKLSPKKQQLNTDIEDLEQRLSKTEESLKAIVTERPKLAFLI